MSEFLEPLATIVVRFLALVHSREQHTEWLTLSRERTYVYEAEENVGHPCH